MFDIGFWEMMVVGIVALIVVGPKDLPMMFKTVGRFVGRARSMAREFQRSMEDAADETGLKDAAKSMNDLRKIGLDSPTKTARAYAQKQAKSAMGMDEEPKAATPEAAPGKAAE